MENQIKQFSQNNYNTKETQNKPRLQTEEMNFKKVKEDERFIYYEGLATISGKYQEYQPEVLLGGTLCFFVDEKTGNLIPKVSGDNRSPWFCFNDQGKAKRMFEINDNAIFNNKAVECIQGKATITISNYKIDKKQGEAFDTADIKEIISKETYTTKCE